MVLAFAVVAQLVQWASKGAHFSSSTNLGKWLNMSAEKVSSPVRDRIRGKILSEKVRSTTIELDDGSKVMVRSTTVGQMLATIEMPDAKARMARMLIETCFVAETGEPLFDEADYDALMELPSDGSYRKLVDAVSEQTVEKKTNEAKKPSEQETPGSS